MSTRRLLGESLTSAGVVNGVIQDDWDQIIKICKAGRAQDFYSLGDTKTISLTNGNSYPMMLVAFDADLKADKTGFVNTTWISTNFYSTGISVPQGLVDMNSVTNYSQSNMKKMCDEKIYQSLADSDLKKNIIQVVKVQLGIDSYLSTNAITDSSEYVWVPSMQESLSTDSLYHKTWEISSGKQIAFRDISCNSSKRAGVFYHVTPNGQSVSTAYSTLGSGSWDFYFGFCL